MLALKIVVLIISSITFVSSILIWIFKKDFLIWNYEEHVEEGYTNDNKFYKSYGIIGIVFSIAIIATTIVSFFKMTTKLYIILILTLILLTLFTLGVNLGVRALFKKEEE